MAALGPLDALYACVAAPAAPAVPLVQRERRTVAQEFPTLPVGGLELTVGEASAALFETQADELALPGPDFDTHTDTLYDALNGAVRVLGPAGIAEVDGQFRELDGVEFPEVGVCRQFGYRLALSFWYEGARSRPMTVGEAAVALYLSDAYRHHQVDAVTVRRAPLLVSRAIRQGAATVPLETLARLGEAMGREFGAPVTAGRDWLYRQALPDWHRRRFCFTLMRADVRQPSPLIVRLDGGAYVLGATPPAGPDGTWRRTLRAEW